MIQGLLNSLGLQSRTLSSFNSIKQLNLEELQEFLKINIVALHRIHQPKKVQDHALKTLHLINQVSEERKIQLKEGISQVIVHLLKQNEQKAKGIDFLNSKDPQTYSKVQEGLNRYKVLKHEEEDFISSFFGKVKSFFI